MGRKHKIDEDLGTPIRNHIIFPDIPERKKVLDVQKSKVKVLVKKNRQVSGDLSQARTYLKPLKATGKLSSLEESQPAATSGGSITQQVLNFQKQLKPLKGSVHPLHKYDGLVPLDSKKSPKEKANAAVRTISSASGEKVVINSYPKFDAETEKR